MRMITTKISRYNLKKGDLVLVIAGKDRGKTGKVESVLTKKAKVKVASVNIIKRHLKPSAKYPRGGIISISTPFNISNVMVICPHCHKPTRVSHQVKNGLKIRICQNCHERIDHE